MGKHILLAEDDEEDIEIFTEAIRNTELPISLTFVGDCDGIFNSINVQNLPDLIVLDASLPGKSLLECINAIRSDERLNNIPLIVLSGVNSRTIQEVIFKAGVNLYLVKPTTFSEIEDIFKRLYHMDWTSPAILNSENFYG